MRFLIILSALLILNSCAAIDISPIIHVTIDNSVISEIDSIFLINNMEAYDLKDINAKKVTIGTNEYSFYRVQPVVILKLKLKNGKQLTSGTFIKKDSHDKIIVSAKNNKIYFEKISRSSFQKYAPLIIIILLVVLIIKLPITLLIIWPSSKIKLLRDLSLLNLLYLVLFVVLMIVISDVMIFLLYPFYFCVLLVDLIFLAKEYNEKGLLRPILTGVVSNLAFITIGQFILTFALIEFL
jgi:hypothetical protein